MARRQKDYICFIFGIILIIVGVIGLVYPEITLKRTKTVKLGPVTVEEPKKQIFHISPYVAGGMIAGGVILIYIGTKK
ncbi:MAG: DUF3185 domain-containing protein [Deltaproteobacteria bacterium]|nr:DUF3185 domain-containing protein [Deltaproteobacteria bacterium]